MRTLYARKQAKLAFTRRTTQYRIECPGCVVYVSTPFEGRTDVDISVDGERYAGESSKITQHAMSPGGLRVSVDVVKG